MSTKSKSADNKDIDGTTINVIYKYARYATSPASEQHTVFLPNNHDPSFHDFFSAYNPCDNDERSIELKGKLTIYEDDCFAKMSKHGIVDGSTVLVIGSRMGGPANHTARLECLRNHSLFYSLDGGNTYTDPLKGKTSGHRQ